MKLSELSTDRALDVLCELTPYVSNICEDGSVVGVIGEKISIDKSMNIYGQFATFIGQMSKAAPILLKTHRVDVYGILSVMNERSVDEIAAQPITDTIQQIKEVFRDTDLLSFFKSSAQPEQTA